jgi:excisionase family DNA binding protein
MAEQSNIRMLTINEAAVRVPGLTKYRIREMCVKGEVPCVKAGRKYLICEQVLIRYLTEPPVLPKTEEQGKIRRIG